MKSADMQPVRAGVRAFFAPVARDSSTPTIFDPALAAEFDLNAPPNPWIDLGEVDSLKRGAGNDQALVQAGSDRTTIAQYRTRLTASVEVEFRSWDKLHMALASGGQHWNVLESHAGSVAKMTGGDSVPAALLLPGSDVQRLVIGEKSAGFAVGDFVAVDEDYELQTGYVGWGIAAAFVPPAGGQKLPTDFVRRVTFNVGRVKAIENGALLLEEPLVAGLPSGVAAVQKVVGFVDRDGGGYRQEWSALFVYPEVSGGRVFFYYPRLQSSSVAEEALVEISEEYQAIGLRAKFIALPATDENDGESVLCCRIYVPNPRTST